MLVPVAMGGVLIAPFPIASLRAQLRRRAILARVAFVVIAARRAVERDPQIVGQRLD